jgi:hypothetical protein
MGKGRFGWQTLQFGYIYKNNQQQFGWISKKKQNIPTSARLPSGHRVARLFFILGWLFGSSHHWGWVVVGVSDGDATVGRSMQQQLHRTHGHNTHDQRGMDAVESFLNFILPARLLIVSTFPSVMSVFGFCSKIVGW